jgi:hypothetical protein
MPADFSAEEAEDLDNKNLDAKLELESESDSDMDEHRVFVAMLKSKNGGKKTSRPMTMTNRERLDRCKGSYIVHCKALSENWDNCESLSIDIAAGPAPNLLQAAVQFGIIEGTMLLAFEETLLNGYVGKVTQSEDSDDGGAASLDYYNDVASTSTSKKRKAATSPPRPKPGRGRPKKQANATRPATRLFIRFRGRDTGEGVIFYRPECGYIDFTDSDCVAFKGVCSMPAVGTKVPFEGFKVDSSAGTQVTPWSSFSESAHEEERVGRWR